VLYVSRMVDIKMRTKFSLGNMNGRERSFRNLNAARIEDCTTFNDRVIDELRECGRKRPWSKWPFKCQLSTAAGALFNLNAQCGIVFPLRTWASKLFVAQDHTRYGGLVCGP
jgi:hypothetical protein